MTEFSTKADLIEIQCDRFQACSGCRLQKNILSPPVWKDVKEYFLSKGCNPSFFSAELIKWRTRVKLAIRGTPRNPQIGLFKHGTHDVLPIPNCPLHHPKINPAIALLKETMISLGVHPYNEKSHKGELRYCQMVVERKTGKLQLSLIVNNSEIAPSISTLVSQLFQSGLFHSVWINFQPSVTNRIFGDKWTLCRGDPLLWEIFNGISICYHPACFGQSHTSLFEKMLESIHQKVLPEKKILELYAGVGVIGLSVASKSSSLVCSEINPHAKECFHASVKTLPQDIQDKVSFIEGSSETCAPLFADADVLIVDPPRKGLGLKLLDAISHSNLEQLIYVSCGPFSFMKNCDELLRHGWHFDTAEGYLLFPGTDHVEIIGFLKRD